MHIVEIWGRDCGGGDGKKGLTKSIRGLPLRIAVLARGE